MVLRQLISSLACIFSLFIHGCEHDQKESSAATQNRLSGTFWQLDTYGYRGSQEQGVLISTPYTLDFRSSANHAVIKFDCKNGELSYVLDKTLLSFETQRLTESVCTFSGVATYEDQERFIYEVIGHSESFEVNGNNLFIRTDDDAQLTFVKIEKGTSYHTSLAELAPFQSDGCSSFPNGTLFQQELWLQCCTVHDYAYWKGGREDEREAADLALRECVAEVGEKEIALLMLLGVRVGGSPLFPTPYRWGYGWPYPKDYGQLSDDELQLVEEMAYLQP